MNTLLLLDTHVLLWLDRDDSQLGVAARSAISAAWDQGSVVVSAISFWEASMLQSRQRIALPVNPQQWRNDWLTSGLQECPLDGAIGLAAVSLDGFHQDPADRFIAATAQTLQAQLVTADAAILNWSGSLPRLDARR